MRYGVWAPIPMWVGGTQKWAAGRAGRTPTVVAIHRMEGSLMGSDGYLRRERADYYPYPRLNASTHFGIGDWNGSPQIRQWVDTRDSAWGWYARPPKYSSLLATALAPDYANRGTDLNWKVIAIEYAGFAHQPWNHRWTPKLRELLTAIRNAHGNLYIVLHNDNSFKSCPGVPAFRAAFPGWHGNRLNNVLAPLPDTSTPAPPVGPIQRADGAPSMRFRAEYRSAVIKAGKPIRDGASINAKTVATTKSDERVQIVGRMRTTGSYDPWYVFAYYLGNGHAFVYAPGVDFR